MNTENNKIIAEFMGLNNKIVHFEKFYSWSDAPFFYTTEDSKEKVVENIAKYSKYHSDWNWLMEVVEKIEDLPNGRFKIEIYNTICRIYDHEEFDEVVELSENTKIEATYKACLEFIKWHNQQNF